MPTQRIPLAGSIVTRDPGNFAGRDQTFINCFSYAIGDDLTGGRRIYTEKRRGFTSLSAFTSPVAKQGACIWQSNTTPQLAFSFSNITGPVMQIYNQNGSQIGADIPATNSCFYMIDASASGVGNLVAVFADSSTNLLEGWYFPQGGSWTQIVDGDFPPNQGTPIPIIGGPVSLDGYLFWMCTNGQIWNSDVNSLSSYTANNFITAGSMPDGGTGLARAQDLIIAFGAYSIEFFRNAGNPTGSPLSAVPNSVRRIGAKANTIKTIGDVTYFAGINVETGEKGIYRIAGTDIKKISTTDIDLYLATNAEAYCFGSINCSGYEHILFGGGVSGGLTYWAYCITNGRWWTYNNAAQNIASALSLGGTITHVAGDDKIAKMDTGSAVYTDLGVAMTLTIQTQPIDMGTDKYKFATKLRLIGDKQASTCNMAISWSDDDAVTFSAPVNIDMSSPIDFITRLGRFKRRVFKLTNAVNLPCRLEAMELEYELGSA